ncbi:MAG: pentapeptide repeat-containing protein [Chitinophaga sp.]|uniref:pentapeptide repeat-containing protein n=1 Tax=Chitinophaga sp. TaxID=1869181 RepID=UPI001B279B10|nr:pentapeptide repeat-containing protein [Chitinophaga sp.]MBO9728555.1 pentapeptide repeat-containing protein [Chitinophaga sp.]
MDTQTIGGKIAQARKAQGMSQARLAQQLFISPQAVGKWERGESMPDITTFHRLAEILGVDFNYFSANLSSAPQDTSPSTTPVTPPVAATSSRSQDRQVLINLNAIDLQQENFAGVTLHNGKFKVSSLQGTNFTGADLTGSSFNTLDAREANFEGANLTDCHFSIVDLTDAVFNKTILIRTTLHMSGQGARFTDVTLTDVNFATTELNKTVFERCIFDGVDFHQCNLEGACFDEQSFIGVQFNKSSLKNASFKGATLKNVTFKLPFSFTNKSYRALQSVCFDGATMDKLTYTALKGLYVNLKNVIIA